MPGYERSRIISVADDDLDEFTCAICLGIFVNPVATLCCRQTYCKDCIWEWVSMRKTCPNDRKPLSKKALKPVPRVLVNLLENMKIKCNYEWDGCSHVSRIGDLAQHLSVCEFRPNQLCKTCGLIKESVLTHNCIQSLISEKQKIDAKYLNLLDENSSLLLMCREKDELINSCRQELAHSKAIHQRAIESLKDENGRAIRDLKLCYAKAYEELRDDQADEVDRLRSVNAKQERRISNLKWELNQCERQREDTQSILKARTQENLNLFNELQSTRNSLGTAVTALAICVGVYLFRYFY